MKKSILIATGLSVLLSVALYAHGDMGTGMMMDDENSQNQQQMHYNQNMGNNGYGMASGNMMYGNYPNMMNNGFGMMNGNMMYGNSSSMMNMFYQLHLTSSQMEKISKIQIDMYKNLQGFDSAFTKNSFDKDKYIKIMKERRDNMIKNRAEMIEKVYKILTPEQKEYLKNTMNFMHDRMMHYGGNR
jgi:periplasmic protein CpxP/Spy